MKFVLIGLAALALVKIARHRRGRRCGSRRSRRFSKAGSWMMMRHLSRELSLSKEQEAIVEEQFKLFRARLSSLDIPGDTRRRVANIMRSESFDENLLGELFVQHDDSMRVLRLELVERLAAVHDALDPVQRETLAQRLERTREHGPYRA